jgi:hypothetical protein
MSFKFTRPLGQRLILAAAISDVLLLAACGGGSGSAAAPTATAQGATAVYFTDDFSATYDAVWLNVSRVTVVSPSAETELAAFAPAKLINLPTLRRTGALIATATIPADATAVRVYVGTQAQLQQLDGTLLNVTLAAPTGYLEFKLDGWSAGSGALALDFDLPRFTLQGSTAVPATRVADAKDYGGWNQRYAEVEGTVAQVTATSLVVDTRSFGQRTFVLDANTTFVSGRSATWTPGVGDRVEIKSAVAGQGASGLQFTARTVKDETGSATGGLTKVEGLVTGVSGTQVTATVDHSENGSALGSVTFDIAAATFKRGSVAALVPGARVEAYLTQAGAAWTAKVIEIEGAAKSDSGERNSQSYAEVKGQIVSVAGSSVVVKALYSERIPGLNAGASITIDLAAASFDVGALSCLAAGAPIEVKGSVNAAGALAAIDVSLGGACAAAYPAADGGASSGHDAPVTAGTIDTEGSVTAVRTGEFDMLVFDLENTAISSTTVTVRYNSSTALRHLAAADITVGRLVEVKGDLSAGVITATKIESR